MTEQEFLTSVFGCRTTTVVRIRNLLGPNFDRSISEDIVDGAIAAVWLKVSRSPTRPHNLGGLLYVTARADALNYLCRHLPTIPMESLAWVGGDEADASHAVVHALSVQPEAIDVKVDLQRALAKLEPSFQRLLWAVHVEGQEIREIARVQHRYPMAVWRDLKRAERRLRQLLWAYAPECRD